MTLVDKVAALRDFLRPPADLALIPALAWMCENMGASGDGTCTIPEQVEELLALTGVTISMASPAAAAPAAAAPTCYGVCVDT